MRQVHKDIHQIQYLIYNKHVTIQYGIQNLDEWLKIHTIQQKCHKDIRLDLRLASPLISRLCLGRSCWCLQWWLI